MSRPSFDMTGVNALVTGASSGLGAHFARTLAAAGAKVVVAARRTDRLAELATAIEAAGGRAVPVGLDVTSVESVRAGFAAAETELGPITVLVNNSGVAVPKRLLDQTEEDWDQVVDTNLKGAWLMAQEFARRLAAQNKPGRIINIASVLGIRTIGYVAPYTASKAGLIHLTRVMALELAPLKIQANAIAPGYFATEMNSEFLAGPAGQSMMKRVPLGRFGAPADLDGVLLLLASDAGRYINGITIPVDGGHLVSSL
jgi:NAD(P)-dependent dehydrogenase (short-subunit alcohol dehydrogenase family)